MAQNTEVNLLIVPIMLAAILSLVRLCHFLRARTMRTFAAKCGFRYVGPSAPPHWWLNPTRLEAHAPVPKWIGHVYPFGRRIRQVWNVIEGERNGTPIVIFDAVIGEFRGGDPCTLIAYQTEQNPFDCLYSAQGVKQTNGWTVLYGVKSFFFHWIMDVKRLESNLRALDA